MSKKKPREEKAPDESNRRKFLGSIGGAAAATIVASTVVGAKGSQQATAPTPADACEVGTVTGACAIAVDRMTQEGRIVQILGRVRDGKVIFDQSNLEIFARKYPNADMAFVAVNAPFDPMPHACTN